jgi:cytochrome c553
MKKNKRLKKYICITRVIAVMLTLSILLMSSVGSAANIDVGKKIFDENCNYCHGGNPPERVSDAQGILILAQDAKTREEIIGNVIRSGTPDGMPSYNKSDISDVDINYIVAYLKSVPNSFDFSETTPINTKNPETTPMGTIPNEQMPVKMTKAPGFEIIFGGLSILTVYMMIRRNYRL